MIHLVLHTALKLVVALGLAVDLVASDHPGMALLALAITAPWLGTFAAATLAGLLVVHGLFADPDVWSRVLALGVVIVWDLSVGLYARWRLGRHRQSRERPGPVRSISGESRRDGPGGRTALAVYRRDTRLLLWYQMSPETTVILTPLMFPLLLIADLLLNGRDLDASGGPILALIILVWLVLPFFHRPLTRLLEAPAHWAQARVRAAVDITLFRPFRRPEKWHPTYRVLVPTLDRLGRVWTVFGPDYGKGMKRTEGESLRFEAEGDEFVSEDDSVWQGAIEERLAVTDFVAIDVSVPSSNVLWELEQARIRIPPEQILLFAEQSVDARTFETFYQLRDAGDRESAVPVSVLRYDPLDTLSFLIAVRKRILKGLRTEDARPATRVASAPGRMPTVRLLARRGDLFGVARSFGTAIPGWIAVSYVLGSWLGGWFGSLASGWVRGPVIDPTWIVLRLCVGVSLAWVVTRHWSAWRAHATWGGAVVCVNAFAYVFLPLLRGGQFTVGGYVIEYAVGTLLDGALLLPALHAVTRLVGIRWWSMATGGVVAELATRALLPDPYGIPHWSWGAVTEGAILGLLIFPAICVHGAGRVAPTETTIV